MYRLEMKDIYKSFGGVHALKGVQLCVEPGEVHALIGENGAGKSTLMKILSCAITKDAGEILIDGQAVDFSSPKQAIAYGVSVIYQELNMAPHMTVMENIFLGNYPSRAGVLNRKEMFKRSQQLLDDLGADLSPTAVVGSLPVAKQQMVEIARAIKNNSKIIVFDEPSAVLGKADSEVLFQQIEKLKNSGVSIIYISHRLEEILRISDKVTVFRDGGYVTTQDTKGLEVKDLVSFMTGKDYSQMWPNREAAQIDPEVALEVRGLNRGDIIRDVSFQLHKGEVLGLAGLVGAGRTEIARAIFGADPKDSGEILIQGQKVQINNPADAIRHGIGFVLEDRKTQGLLIEQPIADNITLTGLKKYVTYGVLGRKKELHSADRFKEMLGIKTNNIKNPVMSLSGGNQQKVAIAKWLHTEPQILILDEPTRGVDVGAKAEIYKIIEELKAQGKAILLISSEFAEILGLSDRIVVIRRGEVAATFTHEEAMADTKVLDAFADQGGVGDHEHVKN